MRYIQTQRRIQLAFIDYLAVILIDFSKFKRPKYLFPGT